MVECLSCREPIPKSSALIRGGVMGTAGIEAYYHCPACGRYTLAVYVDSMTGRDSITYYGPFAPEPTEVKLAIIARCPDPLNRNCRCEAHREYVRIWLDETWEGAG